MGSKVSSRERMLAAIRREEVDYVPLSTLFSESQTQERKLRDWQQGDAYGEHSLQYQVEELGLDPVVLVAIPPGRHPDATSRVWEERRPGEPYPVLHKEIMTPAGPLTPCLLFASNGPGRTCWRLSMSGNVCDRVNLKRK